MALMHVVSDVRSDSVKSGDTGMNVKNNMTGADKGPKRNGFGAGWCIATHRQQRKGLNRRGGSEGVGGGTIGGHQRARRG